MLDRVTDGSDSRTIPAPITARVASLWRCPIKSTAGEVLDAAALDQRGLTHDRGWAAYTDDGGIASGKTTRRFRKIEGLMHWRSNMPAGADGTPQLIAPDGSTYLASDPAASKALSHAFGRPLTLRQETTVRHHDESGVHVVTTASLRRVEQLIDEPIDPLRLRANIVLDTAGVGFVEDGWIGADIAIGTQVVLRLGPGMVRCVMADQAQADVAPARPMLQTLGRAHDLQLGLQATVIQPGTIRIGDEACVLPR